MADRPVLTLHEVARYLNVHRNTIYRLAQRGAVPAFKVGSDWRFNRESIDAWRLAQERVLAKQISSATAADSHLRTDLLDLIEWYFAEAMQSSVSLNDLGIFFQDNQRPMRLELRRMVADGWLELINAGKQKQYRLTPAGLAQVRTAGERLEKTETGHGSFVRTVLNRPHSGGIDSNS